MYLNTKPLKGLYWGYITYVSHTKQWMKRKGSLEWGGGAWGWDKVIDYGNYLTNRMGSHQRDFFMKMLLLCIICLNELDHVLDFSSTCSNSFFIYWFTYTNNCGPSYVLCQCCVDSIQNGSVYKHRLCAVCWYWQRIQTQIMCCMLILAAYTSTDYVLYVDIGSVYKHRLCAVCWYCI